MASTISIPQQNQGLPVRNLDSGASIDSSLIDALAKYVTTGSGARNTTEEELQDLASKAISKPGGRAQLEALIHPSELEPDIKVWKNQAAANGHIELSKTTIGFTLHVPTLKLTYKGNGVGVFVPHFGPLNAGTIYYDSTTELGPGPATFKLQVIGLSLYVNIYVNQVRVASFFFGPISFVMAPGVTEGDGAII
ncbi:hypothetical protein B0T10DRAFT_573223 [Thelonectria olida]|uniref:Uncharacterized protein n=1 Tax=Thelonectria olida TaxID=1576542 RepID=A0A9P8W5M2_9HYPO|nr:hypothetical protein B0T10DRAFT_573223 [Thelonectria olida]